MSVVLLKMMDKKYLLGIKAAQLKVYTNNWLIANKSRSFQKMLTYYVSIHTFATHTQIKTPVLQDGAVLLGSNYPTYKAHVRQ